MFFLNFMSFIVVLFVGVKTSTYKSDAFFFSKLRLFCPFLDLQLSVLSGFYNSTFLFYSLC